MPGTTRFRRRMLALATLSLLTLATGIVSGTSAQAKPWGHARPLRTRAKAVHMPAEDAAKGLVYRGLRRGTGRCAGGFQLVGRSRMCTAGPDAAPAGVNVKLKGHGRYKKLPTKTTDPTAGVCGTDGVRVQAVYARAADVADRYDALLSTLRGYAGVADTIFRNSAAATGGVRRIRYVTDAGCHVQVARATLSASGDDSFANTIAELKAQGFTRTDRKYLVWVDAGIYCGIGTVVGDDSPGSTNANNRGPSYGRVDRACWGGPTEAHELAHNLGAVQLSAPNSSGGWHCTDESDRMCYQDGSAVTMVNRCPSTHENLLDCNHDDYFHTAPPRGSYLDTHWNIARSPYLSAS